MTFTLTPLVCDERILFPDFLSVGGLVARAWSYIDAYTRTGEGYTHRSGCHTLV
jgi:hypothetical protein